MAEALFYTEMVKIDGGTTYKVKDVQSQHIAFAKPVENIFTLGNDLSITLKQNLMVGNEVTIPVADVESKGLGALVIDDFTVVEPDDLDKYKAAKRNKVYGIFSHFMATASGLRLFEYFMSFSVLASKGYFITEENREEKYLEIINTGDQDLIAALETFLDNFDFISPISTTYKELKEFETALPNAQTEEEVDALVQPFEAKM